MPDAPCSSCPWRRSSPVDGSAIPRFSMELMRALSNTVGEGDAFRPVMACHGSSCSAEVPCAGYLAVEGYSNLNVRLGAIQGRPGYELGAVARACAGMDLWPSFAAMLGAYEAGATRSCGAGLSGASTC